MQINIINGRIITPEGIKDGVLVIEGSKIRNLQDEIPHSGINIDAQGRYVSAGFIDIHTHGGGGYDFMDGTADSFEGAVKFHMKHGTTSIVPTSLSGSDEEIMQLFSGFREAKRRMEDGPEMLGLHLEGPYFALSQKGAQDPRFIKAPDRNHYEWILGLSDDLVRWSIAPELYGALELGRILKDRNILAAMGHSDAMYEDIRKAIECGYTHVTHLYSGMSSLKRVNAFRVLGMVECSYLFDELTVEIIADGKHLPPELLKLIVKCKDNSKICLITDSLRCAGFPDGTETFSGSKANGQKVIIEDGVAKMPDRSCFAGSICTADRCIKTMYHDVGLPIEEAVRMMTINPARIMNVDSRKGSLEPWKDADVCIFDDDINVSTVICRGVVTYNAS